MIQKTFLFMILIGISLPLHSWNNWAKNQQCKAKIITPKNLSELIAIVKKADQEKATIRAYGSGHSWSDIVCPADYLIATHKLNKLLSVNRSNNQVTVQAGIKIKTLNRRLARLGLALSNQAAITEQSIAGIIATATHGSGKTGTFASFITQLQLVTADGTLKTISATENADLFGAVRTSIGSLGIVATVTIQCEPQFTVQRTMSSMNWQELLQNYTQLLADNEFTQWYWSAADDSVAIINHNRIATPSKKRIHTNSESIGPSYHMLAGSPGGIYMEEEIAIPLEAFAQAAQAARELVRKELLKNNLFSGILFRFVKAEQNNYLSPASNQGVIFFSITTSCTSGYESFYRAFYKEMLAYKGRPHWGKINYLTQSDARMLYGNEFEQFLVVRKKLDPHGRFSNDFTKRIFGW